jgi:hypothetical protein
MFWTFNLSFDILATVLATFPNIGQIFAQFSGHFLFKGLTLPLSLLKSILETLWGSRYPFSRTFQINENANPFDMMAFKNKMYILGSGGICLHINYLVLNETKRYKYWLNTKDFGLENYSFNTGNIHSKIGQIVT